MSLEPNSFTASKLSNGLGRISGSVRKKTYKNDSWTGVSAGNGVCAIASAFAKDTSFAQTVRCYSGDLRLNFSHASPKSFVRQCRRLGARAGIVSSVRGLLYGEWPSDCQSQPSRAGGQILSSIRQNTVSGNIPQRLKLSHDSINQACRQMCGPSGGAAV
jgi:hypothetical protein